MLGVDCALGSMQRVYIAPFLGEDWILPTDSALGPLAVSRSTPSHTANLRTLNLELAPKSDFYDLH